MLKAIVCSMLLTGGATASAVAGTLDFQGNISQYSCSAADSSDDCKDIRQQISRAHEPVSQTSMQASLHNQLASSEVRRLTASSAVLTISYN